MPCSSDYNYTDDLSVVRAQNDQLQRTVCRLAKIINTLLIVGDHVLINWEFTPEALDKEIDWAHGVYREHRQKDKERRIADLTKRRADVLSKIQQIRKLDGIPSPKQNEDLRMFTNLLSEVQTANPDTTELY